MTPLRSRRLPQLTSKPSCAYSPLGVDAAVYRLVGAAFRCLQVGLGFAGGLVVPGGVGRRYELAVPGRQSPGWHSLQSATGAGAMPVPGFAKQSAVLGQQMRRGRTVCSLQSATGAGAMPVPGRAHWGTRERCTFWADLHLALRFPQVAFFKGANLPKPVHTPRLRPRRTPLTPHTHPPTPRPQMPNRTKNRQIYLPLPYFRRSLSPKIQICRFSVPSPPNSTDGAECARHLMGCS